MRGGAECQYDQRTHRLFNRIKGNLEGWGDRKIDYLGYNSNIIPCGAYQAQAAQAAQAATEAEALAALAAQAAKAEALAQAAQAQARFEILADPSVTLQREVYNRCQKE